MNWFRNSKTEVKPSNAHHSINDMGLFIGRFSSIFAAQIGYLTVRNMLLHRNIQFPQNLSTSIAEAASLTSISVPVVLANHYMFPRMEHTQHPSKGKTK